MFIVIFLTASTSHSNRPHTNSKTAAGIINRRRGMSSAYSSGKCLYNVLLKWITCIKAILKHQQICDNKTQIILYMFIPLCSEPFHGRPGRLQLRRGAIESAYAERKARHSATAAQHLDRSQTQWRSSTWRLSRITAQNKNASRQQQQRWNASGLCRSAIEGGGRLG